MEHNTGVMTSSTPPPSQEFKENDPDDLPTVSPKLPSYPAKAPKERKPPTVTPRTFTRFFTPKSLSVKPGHSRKALRDLSASATNSRTRREGRRRAPLAVEVNGDDLDRDRTSKRRKMYPLSPALSVELSSPIKIIHHDGLELPYHTPEDVDSGGEDDDDSDGEALPYQSRPIQRAKFDPLGQGLRRELYGPASSRQSPESKGSSYIQCCQTGSFFSRPDDIHRSKVVRTARPSIPFCATPCNNNTLVAVGDEDGGIRLLESSSSKFGWSQPYLEFRPHHNAILDLSFSSDDLLLVTASGDQTCRVIDMPTQRTTHTLSGHVSSVKQTQFQPGSSHVIASSSRDGSIQIWDLRCKGFDGTVKDLRIPLDPNADQPPTSRVTFGRSVNTMFDAHMMRSAYTGTFVVPRPTADGTTKIPANFDTPSKTESPGRRGDVSVTALQFLPSPRSHLLLSGSEADASIRLWDLRTTYNHRRGHCVPLSVVPPPQSHTRLRNFGLNSLTLSTNADRIYSLCRDNTVYAYSTSHIILGSAPELQYPNGKPGRCTTNTREKAGLAPLYGFRHPGFHATSFYVKASARKARDDKTELLAVGSSDGTPVLFPTDEKILRRRSGPSQSSSASVGRARPSLLRTDSFSNARLEDTIPIYDSGTRLVGGHTNEVTAVSWSHGGELVSVCDDYRVRLWREGDVARRLRAAGQADRGQRWECGWAEVDAEWDEEEG